MSTPRVGFDELISYISATYEDPLPNRAPGQPPTISFIARLLNVDRNTIYRCHQRSSINLWQADRFAITLGLHPSEIWPEWYRIGSLVAA